MSHHVLNSKNRMDMMLATNTSTKEGLPARSSVLLRVLLGFTLNLWTTDLMLR